MKEVLKILEYNKAEQDINDWYQFLGFCDFHRIAGYMADKIADAPPQAHRHLKIQKNYQNYRQNILIGAAQEIEAKLIEQKIPHAFLKGTVLSGEIYEPGERSSNDIDVLIEGANISAITHILTGLGFIQGLYKNGTIIPFSRNEIIKRRMNRGETAPFVMLTGNDLVPFIEVDINFSLDWLPTRNSSVINEFLNNCVPSRCGLTALDSEYTLLYLCIHLYKEAVVLSMVRRLKDIELYKYLDIFLMLKKINIKRFWHFTDKYNFRKECEYVIYLTNQLFPSTNICIKEPEELNRVIDPEQGNKAYVWQKDFLVRLNDTGRLSFLTDDKGGEVQ